jgi:hypothetical protein
MGKKSKVCSETDLIKGNFAIGPPLKLEGEGGAPSSLHARLQFFGNEWWLIDCDSANGTYLLVEDAGRPIEMGDMFRIARCEVQLFAVPTQGAPPAGTAP